MGKKIILFLVIITFFLFHKKKEHIQYFSNLKFGIYVKKSKNQIIVFCDPLKINKYTNSFYFGLNLQSKNNYLKKGYFFDLNKKTSKIDIKKSSSDNFIYLKFKDSSIVIKMKSLVIGGEQIFINNYNFNKNDTLILKKESSKVIGIGFSKNLTSVFNKKTKKQDSFNEPFFIIKSKINDSIKILYRTEIDNHFIIDTAVIHKKNAIIL